MFLQNNRLSRLIKFRLQHFRKNRRQFTCLPRCHSSYGSFLLSGYTFQFTFVIGGQEHTRQRIRNRKSGNWCFTFFIYWSIMWKKSDKVGKIRGFKYKTLQKICVFRHTVQYINSWGLVAVSLTEHRIPQRLRKGFIKRMCFDHGLPCPYLWIQSTVILRPSRLLHDIFL